ncbi:hypothetical protein [Streptomyces sp. R35]|uniref:DUF1906 domain-containing protein n=1 Tax=Streptomyces sp. R35 TaxID=3238630 RepID=A0AB39SKB8_9ACTN
MRGFTNERGERVPGLHQFGAVRSTVVYDIFKFTCDDDGGHARGGALPGRAAYQAQVHAYIEQFGGEPGAPVVLDFEDILLTELSGRAARHALDLWKRLIIWTKETVPGSPVGMYGFDWKPGNRELTRELYEDGLLDLFAPEAYWWPDQTRTTWTDRFAAAVGHARALAPGKPVHPYFHPHYIGGGELPPDVWSYSVDRFRELADGVVIWEPSTTNAGSPAAGWVSRYAQEWCHVSDAAGPLTVTLGSVAAVRGSTVTARLTVTNVSATATDATPIDSADASFDSPVVPALPPGAAWTCAAGITVPPHHPYSTIPLRLALGAQEVCLGIVVD